MDQFQVIADDLNKVHSAGWTVEHADVLFEVLGGFPRRGARGEKSKMLEPPGSSRIYRYLTFAKFLSMLELRALWMCRLGKLEDDFEGTLPSKVRELLTNEAQTWKKTFTDPRLQHQLDEMPDRNVLNGRAMLVVNCWFMGESESEQMWKRYSTLDEGLAIRSTVDRLGKAVLFWDETTQIGRVQYVDFDEYEMDLYHGNQADERAMLKRKDYSYENEVRLATLNYMCRARLNADGSLPTQRQLEGPGSFDPHRPGLYLHVDLNVLIEEVVTSPSAQLWFSNLVSTLCRRYALRSKVRASSLCSFP